MSDKIVWQDRAARIVDGAVLLSRKGEHEDFDIGAGDGGCAFSVGYGVGMAQIREVEPLHPEVLLLRTNAGLFALITEGDGPPCVRQIRAFTLIELLLCISIIALLLAVLLPSLAASRRSAHDSRCLQNAHALAQAASSYYLACGRIGQDLGEVGTTDGPTITCPEDPQRRPFSYVWQMPAGNPLGSAPLNVANTLDSYNWSEVPVVSDRLDYRHNLRGKPMEADPDSAQWRMTWRFWGFLDAHAEPLRGPSSTALASWMP